MADGLARPAVGTRFTLPRDVIPRVRTAVWRVSSTTPSLVRYVLDGDPRAAPRPITATLQGWHDDAEVLHG